MQSKHYSLKKSREKKGSSSLFLPFGLIISVAETTGFKFEFLSRKRKKTEETSLSRNASSSECWITENVNYNFRCNPEKSPQYDNIWLLNARLVDRINFPSFEFPETSLTATEYSGKEKTQLDRDQIEIPKLIIGILENKRQILARIWEEESGYCEWTTMVEPYTERQKEKSRENH
ncbi:hypothetical protein CDAR_439311 [Caerostris darwini]|uniref:Uncharacterized protein n=1 Tax=Caerostris darwini TaxID=1538125 RepID=A0AAV4MHQ7_9ARAC|nr:hypothetical protein CDAR_439311 [Caerostris darwini]